jgi:hypothetical protein
LFNTLHVFSHVSQNLYGLRPQEREWYASEVASLDSGLSPRGDRDGPERKPVFSGEGYRAIADAGKRFARVSRKKRRENKRRLEKKRALPLCACLCLVDTLDLPPANPSSLLSFPYFLSLTCKPILLFLLFFTLTTLYYCYLSAPQAQALKGKGIAAGTGLPESLSTRIAYEHMVSLAATHEKVHQQILYNKRIFENQVRRYPFLIRFYTVEGLNLAGCFATCPLFLWPPLDRFPSP